MATNDVSANELVNALIDFNKSSIDRTTVLMRKLKNDILNASSSGLQGETEELLRTILDGIMKSIETLLSIQEQLQASAIESFFPAQD